MAQKVTVELVDDLDGSPIHEGKGGTISFALERKVYEIDLNDKNAQKLKNALAPYIEAARPATRASEAPKVTRTRRSASSHDLAAVRAWSRDNGHEVSDRGRVPAAVLRAYDEAH
jgi:Lsr2